MTARSTDRPRRHVLFAAPFFMEATLKFISGAARLPGVALSVVSQDPESRIPDAIRRRLAGHWQVKDALDPQQLVDAARSLGRVLGPPERLLAALEQMQVPLARAREHLGISGLSVQAAINFRDKASMKDVMAAANLPCARHALVASSEDARRFLTQVGYPVVVKPPAGAGGKATWRLNGAEDLANLLAQVPLRPDQPALFEEFVAGEEFSFDSVLIDGEPVWHSISRYQPAPLTVLENDWIQWSVVLPRDVSGPEFDPIRQAGFAAVKALGMETGLSHMEWFQLSGGRIAISEAGARPPGAQITSLLSYAHDLDFYQAWPRLMIFDEFEPPPRRYAVGAVYLR
ncbi:MAG: ATP-grasp domain-containing protein, partial [Pseudomonadota bacterium]